MHALVGYGRHGIHEEIRDFKCQACGKKCTARLIPVMQVGGRSQEVAFSVVHKLKGILAAGCVPVFSTDGLKHYFYALTANFGKWESMDGKKPVWAVLSDFVYGQMVKHQCRQKTAEVERKIVWGEEKQYQERLKKAGLGGRINTAFIKRVNLTIRQWVSKLTRRTWGPAKFTPKSWNISSGGEAIITLSDHMIAWKKNHPSRSNGRENNSPGSTGSGLQPFWLG